jgi:hypothetical protein
MGTKGAMGGGPDAGASSHRFCRVGSNGGRSTARAATVDDPDPSPTSLTLTASDFHGPFWWKTTSYLGFCWLECMGLTQAQFPSTTNRPINIQQNGFGFWWSVLVETISSLGFCCFLMNGANPIPVSFYYQQADKHSTEATTVTVSKRKEKNIAKHVSPWSSCCAFLLVQPATTHSDGREWSGYTVPLGQLACSGWPGTATREQD